VSCRICGQRIREQRRDDIAGSQPIILERVMSGELFSAIIGKAKRRKPETEEREDELGKQKEKEKDTSELEAQLSEINENLKSASLILRAKEAAEEDSESAKDEDSQILIDELVGNSIAPEPAKPKRIKKRLVVAGAPPSVTININAPGSPQSVVPVSGDSGAQKRVDTARIRTYIDGLDEALGGGIPEGHVVIVCGSPGTMKSTLSFYILGNNAIAAGRKGLYVTLEESSGSLLRQACSVGMQLEKIGTEVGIIDLASLGMKLKNTHQNWIRILKYHIEKALGQGEYKLLVLDSLGALEVLGKFKDRRREMFKLFQWLRNLGLTTFIIAERPDVVVEGNVIQGRWDEEFLADGIIQMRLHHAADCEIQRRIRCVKMRGTRHENDYLAMLVDDGVFRVTKAISS